MTSRMTHMLYSRGRLVDNALYVNSAVSIKGEPRTQKRLFALSLWSFERSRFVFRLSGSDSADFHPPVSGRPSPPLHPARARSSQTEQISENVCREVHSHRPIDQRTPGRCRASTLHTNREFSTLYPLLRPPPHTSSIISIEVGRSGEARRGSVGGLQVHVTAEAA